jgi:hypothetical protein
MAITHPTRLCSLEAVVGKAQACPEDACPFWEPGGAVLGGRCAFDELGVATNAEFASWLLEIRGRLDSAGSSEAEDAVRHQFRHLLNESSE